MRRFGSTHGLQADGTVGSGSIIVQVRDSVFTAQTANGKYHAEK